MTLLGALLVGCLVRGEVPGQGAGGAASSAEAGRPLGRGDGRNVEAGPPGHGAGRSAEAGRPPSVVARAGVALRRVATREPVVALTFDACATSSNAFGFDEALYEILRREDLPATVFLGGRWIEEHRAAAQALAALPQVELGNHSYTHPPFSDLSRARIVQEIDRTEARIRELGRVSIGFRPPFGDWSRALLPVAKARQLPVVLWDVVSGDAGGHLLPRTMVRQTMQEVQPGSIVIFHINGRGPRTHEALPEILTQLGQRGLRPVRLSQLLALADAQMVPAQPARYRRRVTLHEVDREADREGGREADRERNAASDRARESPPARAGEEAPRAAASP